MSPDKPKYELLDTPPPDDAPGPRLEVVPAEELQADDYVIEDLEAADSPTGGMHVANLRCQTCYCTA